MTQTNRSDGRRFRRKALALLAAVLPVLLVGARLPGMPPSDFPSGNLITYEFGTTATAGVWSVAYAFTSASLDFELNGSATFAGKLFACDFQSPDSDKDGELSDEARCDFLANLTADTSLSSMSADKAWYVVEITTAANSDNAKPMLTIKGGYAIGSGGGNGVSVSSWAEVESAMRAADLPTGETGITDSVNLIVTFADDFSMDETSTSPFEINLPVGGGEHPQITIDFGGHTIVNQADPVIMVDFGNPNGRCTEDTITAFHQGNEDCAGVSHDYDVRIKNGMVTSKASTSSPTDCTDVSESCARTLIETENADALFFQSSTDARYGGRIYFEDLKLGGSANEWAPTSDIADVLAYRDDECIRLEPSFTVVTLSGIFSECWHGLTVSAGESITNATDISAFGAHILLAKYTHRTNPTLDDVAGTCSACEDGGLFNFEIDSAGSVIVGQAELKGAGVMGNLRGGWFDFDVVGRSIPLDDSWDETRYSANVAFLDNGSDASEFLNGEIRFTGHTAVQKWVISEAIGNIVFKANFTPSATLLAAFDSYPAFYYPDGTDTTRNASVLDISASGVFNGGATFDFVFQDPITGDPDSDYDGSTGDPWGGIIDAQIAAGTVLSNDYEFFKLTMGQRGSRIIYGSSGDAGDCIIGRDIDDGGDTACHFLNGAFTCEADTNGVCNDAT